MTAELSGAALDAVAAAERSLLGTDPPLRRLLRAGATVWDPDDDGIDRSRVADKALRTGPGTPEAEERRPLHASLVRLGKLSDRDRLKVRAYLVVDGEVRSLKVWAGSHAVAAADRELDVRGRIAGLDAYRAPPVLAQGRSPTLAYLLEPVVFGRHPRSGAERVAMAGDLATSLVEGYAATSEGDRPLSAATHRELGARVDAVLVDPALPWPEEAGDRASLRRAVGRVIARDRRLPVAVTHGDLVASNVIRDPRDRHHVVDWEHGRRGPAAFDLVKLVLNSGDEEAADRAVAPALDALGGRGWRRERATTQLALGVAQFLSWAPGARERAVRAGRGEAFDAEHARRLVWLRRWLV